MVLLETYLTSNNSLLKKYVWVMCCDPVVYTVAD